MDHLVEPPFQLPASESSAGSELDMALCRLGWPDSSRSGMRVSV